MQATIHQPDFMPWIGFFNKIAKSKKWVVLDHVTNNPRSAGLFKRTRILINGSTFWLSLPICRPNNAEEIGMPINEMKLNLANYKSFEKLYKTIRMAYKSSPYFDKHFELVQEYFEDKSPMLLDRNMKFIKSMMKKLSINTEIIFSSKLNLSSKSNEMLIDILNSIDAKTYLCGTGASSYQKDELFYRAGIDIKYNRFKEPKYKQMYSNKHFSGLSIIDSLFMVDIDTLSQWVHDA
tara:strand:- start:343 stop:1050 length:708 start_codon:yes stop_codon:yes gene_type:complete